MAEANQKTEIQMKLGLTEYAKIKYIGADAEFTLTPGGILQMRYEGEFYPRVTLHRVFPFSMEDQYISVQDKEGKEIGLIDKLSDFPAATLKLLKDQMNLRYFAPTIQSVTSVKEDFGYLLWTVETDVGTVVFTSQTSQGVMIQVAENRYVVVDLDGNRFEIRDITKLTPKDLYKIEMYL